MKRTRYFLLCILLSLIGVTATKANVGDVITSLDQLSNTKYYTITAPRGALTLNSQSNGVVSSKKSNGTVDNTAASTAENANKWAILSHNGVGYYLYNIENKCVLNSDGTMSKNLSEPLELMMASNPTGNYVFKIKKGTNTLNNNNSGGFALDAWSAEDGGNRLTIVEAGDFDGSILDDLSTITFNVVDDASNVVATETFNNCIKGVTYAPSFASYKGVTLTTPNAVATGSDQTVSSRYTVDESTFPFKLSKSATSSSSWYMLKVNRPTPKYCTFDGTNIKATTNLTETSFSKETAFCFVGTPFGFKIVNATSTDKAFGPNIPTANAALVNGSMDDAATFVFENGVEAGYESNQILRNVNDPLGYLNDINGTLAYWISAYNRRDAGSNFSFIELPESTVKELFSIEITYNVYLDDALLYSTTMKETKDTAPTFNLNAQSTYLNITGIPETITGTTTTYDIKTTYKETFPFTAGKWYNIAMGRTPNLQIYTTDGVTSRIETQAVEKTNKTWNNYLWRIDGDWYHGFRLFNKALQAYVSYGDTTNPTEKFQAYLTTEDEKGSYFEYVPNSSGQPHLRILNTTNDAYISNCGGPTTTFLTNWNTSANLYDDGALLIFTESHELTDDDISLFTQALRDALAEVEQQSRITVLFSTQDVTDTKTELNAIECSTNAQVDDAIVQISTIMDKFYKKAEGKKFSARNNPDTYYLTATNTEIQATKSALDAEGVFELKYNGNKKFYLHGIYNDTYVNKPEDSSTAPTTSDNPVNDWYVGILDGNTNKVYFANEMSGYNSIHFNDIYKPYSTCGWLYDEQKSQWTISSVSDAKYEELATWKNLDNAIATSEQYTIGTGFGQYTASTNYETALADAKAIAEAHSATKEEVSNAIAAISIDKLTLNMPKEGTFIYIKDADGNYMTCNNTDGNIIKFSADKDKNAIFCFTGNALVAYSTGYYASRNDNKPCNMSDVTTESESTIYHFHPSALTIGKYFITFGGDTRYMYKAADAGNNPSDNGYDFTLEAVESIPVTISSAKMATLYSPVALNIPEGVTAYTGQYDSNNSVIKLTELQGVIPANTGVILEGEAKDYDFNITDNSNETESCLSGTVPAISTVSGAYTLQIVNNSLGLYKYTGTSLGGFKAYLVTTSGSKGFAFVKDNDPTGIERVENIKTNNTYYDLNGRVVMFPQKNQIYILNGEKVIIR